MKNIMIILGTFLFGTASCASNSAMEIFKSFDEYQITKVEESRVCWATLSATSSNGVPSFFATYKRKDGSKRSAHARPSLPLVLTQNPSNFSRQANTHVICSSRMHSRTLSTIF